MVSATQGFATGEHYGLHNMQERIAGEYHTQTETNTIKGTTVTVSLERNAPHAGYCSLLIQNRFALC